MPTNEYGNCSAHPDVRIAYEQGDALCGECEYEMTEASEDWEHNPENPYRSHCGLDAFGKGIGNDSAYFTDEVGKLRWLKTGQDPYYPGLYYATKPKMCAPSEPDPDEIPF